MLIPKDAFIEQLVFHVAYLLLGTAGVWRISAINEAGGWKDRTTVEDMDLAVRASLKGWKFVYIGDIKVFNQQYLVCFVPVVP